jgi:hypothetical protein
MTETKSFAKLVDLSTANIETAIEWTVFYRDRASFKDFSTAASREAKNLRDLRAARNRRLSTIVVGATCKCGARTLEGHGRKVAAGYPGHVYTGPFGF